MGLMKYMQQYPNIRMMKGTIWETRISPLEVNGGKVHSTIEGAALNYQDSTMSFAAGVAATLPDVKAFSFHNVSAFIVLLYLHESCGKPPTKQQDLGVVPHFHLLLSAPPVDPTCATGCPVIFNFDDSNSDTGGLTNALGYPFQPSLSRMVMPSSIASPTAYATAASSSVSSGGNSATGPTSIRCRWFDDVVAKYTLRLGDPSAAISPLQDVVLRAHRSRCEGSGRSASSISRVRVVRDDNVVLRRAVRPGWAPQLEILAHRATGEGRVQPDEPGRVHLEVDGKACDSGEAGAGGEEAGEVQGVGTPSLRGSGEGREEAQQQREKRRAHGEGGRNLSRVVLVPSDVYKLCDRQSVRGWINFVTSSSADSGNRDHILWLIRLKFGEHVRDLLLLDVNGGDQIGRLNLELHDRQREGMGRTRIWAAHSDLLCMAMGSGARLMWNLRSQDMDIGSLVYR
ncbi:zeatin O-glucosyltransferase-like [Canna indica]|uniref:Zeatin O-glucosyltransferase-like n=1 Tax=Canna indica TaxID=4628 RepID=A0AAQ3KBA2_9LILI|nr:zeatin O-glucosyltransferase-like [Canna indica]